MSSSSDYVDSDDEDRVVKTSKKGKRPSRATNNKSIIENAGSSDSEGSKSGSDDNASDSDASGKATTSSKRKGAPTKRIIGSAAKRRRNNSGIDERGAIDKELFIDDDDRANVMKMSEKQREQEIFNRMEKLEMKKTREEIEKKLAVAAKNASGAPPEKKDKKKDKKKKDDKRKVDSDSDSDDEAAKSPPRRVDSDGSEDGEVFHKPSEVDRKKKQKSAMANLLQRRKDKEKKDAKKASLSIDDVFGRDKKSESSSSSSSSSSSASSRSSSRESSPMRRGGADSDAEDEKKPVRRNVDSLHDLTRARLSRYKMAKFVHAPFFTKSVTGCFVRVTGNMSGGMGGYRIGQILDVVETAKVYTLSSHAGQGNVNTRTNKGLKLRLPTSGGKKEQVIRLEFVSNSDFTKDEFEEWFAFAKAENSVPNMDFIEKREAEIRRVMNYNYSNSDIDAIIKEKGRFTETPKNFAMTKGNLMKKKEYAEQLGDHATVAKLMREIDELDSKADMLDKKRSADISAITWINQRNRNKMKDNFLGDKVHMDMTLQDDPFTRKKDRMKVGGSKATSGQSSESLTEKAPESSTPGSNPRPGPSIPGRTDRTPFSLPGLNKGNIDIDLGRLSANRSVGRMEESILDSSTASTSSVPVEPRGRPVSLEDYRRRKANLL